MDKKIGVTLAALLLTVSTVGCGPLGETSRAPESAASAQKQTASQENQTSTALKIPPPVALPPNYDNRPPQPGETKTQTMPNGLPALQPKGVNVEGLFAEDISDTNRRFERLENAVQGLRSEFESFKPAIVRLVSVESDIQDLIKQLDILLRNEPPTTPAAPPMQLNPADSVSPPEPAQTKTQSPTPTTQPKVTSDGANRVTSFRVGTHRDKIRLVMDLPKKTPYTADLDNQENLLIIELPEAGWGTAPAQSFARSGLLQSYSVEPINNGQGSRVILSLKKSTQILKQQALPPGPNPNYRIYMDLKL